MKRCPRCNRIYSENDLNFCLDDGELLTAYSDEQPTRSLRDDPPPTYVIDSPRVTDPIGWPAREPIGQWHGQTGISHPQPQYQPFTMPSSPNQTLAILSLCLGAGSLVVGWCCSNGLLLAPAAIVLGFIAISQNSKNPQAYGGRNMAIGGIAAGGAFLVLYALFILIYGLAAIGGAFAN